MPPSKSMRVPTTSNVSTLKFFRDMIVPVKVEMPGKSAPAGLKRIAVMDKHKAMSRQRRSKLRQGGGTGCCCCAPIWHFLVALFLPRRGLFDDPPQTYHRHAGSELAQ